MAMTMASSVLPATVLAAGETSPEIMHFHVWWDDYRNASDKYCYANAPASGTVMQGNYVDVELHDYATGGAGEIQKDAASTNGWSTKDWGYAGVTFRYMGKAWQSDEFWGNLYDARNVLDTAYVVAKIRPDNLEGIDTAYLAVTSANSEWAIEEWVIKRNEAGSSAGAPKDITPENYPELTGGVKVYNSAVAGVKLTDYYDVAAGGTQTIAVPMSEFVNNPDFLDSHGKDAGGNFYPQYIESLGFAREDSGAGKKFDIQCTYLGIVDIDAPTAITAELAGEAVNLSWNATANSDVTYKVERINKATGAATTVYEGADTQFTDVLSGAGTFTYTVKAVFTTPDEYKKKNPASSKAGDVIVESAPSPASREVSLSSVDASTLVVADMDTAVVDGTTEIENLFVGDHYVGSGGIDHLSFNEDFATQSIRNSSNVKVGKKFWMNDYGYNDGLSMGDGDSGIGRQITFRPTAAGQYIATRKTYSADTFIERYVGDNWGHVGYTYTTAAFAPATNDISSAAGGYAVYTIEIAPGSCVEDAYLALTYIDTDNSPSMMSSSIGNHHGAIVAGVPLEDYYDTTKMGKQTIAVPLSKFEFSENEDAFLGVATTSSRANHPYFSNRQGYRANQKIQLDNFTGMGVAREDTNADKLEGFQVDIYDLVIAKAPESVPVLSVETNDDDNTLTWTASGYSNTSYTITKSNGTTSEKIDAGRTLSYVDADLANGDYTYTVTAKIGEFAIPAVSNSVSATVAKEEPTPDEPEVPDEPVDSNYTVVEDIDWENWQVAGTDTNLLADRALYVSREGGEASLSEFWNDYQGYWVVENQDYLDIEINDTGYSADFEGDIATHTYVKDASGNKAMQTVPTSDGNLWGYKGTKYFLGAYADIPSNWRKDRWFGIKDVSAYENNGYFAFDVEVSEGADIDNAYLAIEVATKASEVANGGITLPVTDEQIASNTNKWEAKTTFVVGVPMADYYDTTAMGRQKVYVPISEFVNNAAMREMYSKSTSRSVNDFANNLANCPTDLRLFMGMGIAKKNSADYEANPKAFNAKVYDLTVEVPNVKEPKITVTSVDMGSYVGKAWDVEIEDFDGAKSYTAKFVDGSDVKTGEIGFENVEADGGSVAFAIFLHTSRAAVALDVVAE